MTPQIREFTTGIPKNLELGRLFWFNKEYNYYRIYPYLEGSHEQ
jgi:hypothetical protein